MLKQRKSIVNTVIKLLFKSMKYCTIISVKRKNTVSIKRYKLFHIKKFKRQTCFFYMNI